ncbi:rhodanese-like domain-containing protein [Helicovermis profundi]|uniref:Rhodanese domain-containing protein n=1 Tax=Helicovermis profundi TaxID=3065157 RepID=A0AAU9E207_9FIRM|nr:hypothetical protein HLPR_08550 [Clostridia bacterium S502]
MNKNTSKVLSLLLILMLAFSIAGCASTPVTEDTSMEVKEDVAVAEEPAAEVVSLETLENEYFANKPSDSYMVNEVKFVEMVKNNENMTILDIRSANDYAAGHVKGAVNAPWGTAISDILTKIPSDKPLYVYCYSGQTAGQAVNTLVVAGFEARTVHFGWNLGLSKVEGIEAVTSTEANVLTEDVTEINPVVQEALNQYYEGLSAVKDTKYKNYKISEANLKEMLDNKDDSIFLVSVRQAVDFSEGHIEGAINIPWAKGMQEGFSVLPKDKKIVVYCYTGQTAGETTAGLRLMGYDAVSLNGGMGKASNSPSGWLNKGYPVVSSLSLEVLENEYFANMPKHIYKINQVEFLDKVKANEDMTILDIRSADDYAKGHIKGAVNAPWGTAVSDILTKLPSDKPLFVHCYSGQTAGQAVNTLVIAGFDARSVNLGWNFGISKVEGYEEFVTTDESVLTEDVTEIDKGIQSALDAYYAGLSDVKETIFKNYKISEANLKQKIEEKDDSIYILSARSAEDYAKGHIEGAVNLPYGKDMASGFSDLPKDKKIVVYCYSGQTAGQATAAMRLLGYDAVSLNGGMGVGSNAPLGWTNKGYDVVQ